MIDNIPQKEEDILFSKVANGRESSTLQQITDEHVLKLKTIKKVRDSFVSASDRLHGADINALFNVIDEDSTGAIHIIELAVELKRLVPEISRWELRTFLIYADVNGSGILRRDEFVEVLKENLQQTASFFTSPSFQSPQKSPSSFFRMPDSAFTNTLDSSPEQYKFSQYSQLNAGDATGREFLHACFTDFSYAKFLLQSNKFLNLFWTDSGGNSLLHIFAYRDNIEAVKLLFSHSNMNPNVLNYNQETPIHWATKMRGLRVLAFLLSVGGDVNIQDKSGSTALHYCASVGIPEAVPFLLLHGCVDVQDHDGFTALSLAKNNESDEFKAVALLIENQRKKDGKWIMDEETSVGVYNPDGDDYHGIPQRKNFSVQVDEDELAASSSESGILTTVDSLNNLRHHTSFIDLEKRFGTSNGMNSPLFVPSSSISSKSFYESLKNQLLSTNSSGMKLKKLKSRMKRSLSGFWSSTPKVGPFDISSDELPGTHKWALKSDGSVVKSNEIVEEILVPSVLYIDRESLLPRDSCEANDLFLIIEHCWNCSCHSSSLWHDERRYQKQADNILLVLSKYILDEGYTVRLFAFKVKIETFRARYGAFEVSLGFRDGKKWKSQLIHSKLESRCWPALSSLKKNVDIFLSRAIAEAGVSSYVKNRSNLGRPFGEKHYQDWKERMWGTCSEKGAARNTKPPALLATADHPSNMLHLGENDNESVNIAKSPEVIEKAINPQTATTMSTLCLSSQASIALLSAPIVGKPYFDISLLQSESGYRENAAKHFFVFDCREKKQTTKNTQKR